MYVTHVQMSNVRGFRDGDQRVDLSLSRPKRTPAGWTVIAGRNGAGKTTFLRAIALALAGPTSARSLQESFRGWIRDGTDRAFVSVEVEYNANVDKFLTAGRHPKKRFLVGLQWRRHDGSEPLLDVYSEAKAMKSTPNRGPWSEESRGWFVSGYGPFRRLTGHASEAQRLMVGAHHIPRLVSLFREDASLLECTQWLKDLYLRKLEERPGAAELLSSTMSLINDGMLPGNMQLVDVDSDGLWVEQAGAKLPLEDLSDGYRTMIALVLDIIKNMIHCYGSATIDKNDQGMFFVSEPGVLLIDEIDVHLHVSWQQAVGFWLKQRFPNVQFIVSSHSPFVCQAADVEGLIRLPAPDENRVAEHVSPDLHKRIVHGTVDDAVLSELFGLESTRSEETQMLIAELTNIERQMLRGPISKAIRRKYNKLQMELPLTPSGAVEQALKRLEAAGRTHEED